MSRESKHQESHLDFVIVFNKIFVNLVCLSNKKFSLALFVFVLIPCLSKFWNHYNLVIKGNSDNLFLERS